MKKTKMERAWRAVLAYGAAVVLGMALASVFGCSSVDCSGSDTAEFPVQERWWK